MTEGCAEWQSVEGSWTWEKNSRKENCREGCWKKFSIALGHWDSCHTLPSGFYVLGLLFRPCSIWVSLPVYFIIFTIFIVFASDQSVTRTDWYLPEQGRPLFDWSFHSWISLVIHWNLVNSFKEREKTASFVTHRWLFFFVQFFVCSTQAVFARLATYSPGAYVVTQSPVRLSGCKGATYINVLRRHQGTWKMLVALL